jgi:hypothetical protein
VDFERADESLRVIRMDSRRGGRVRRAHTAVQLVVRQGAESVPRRVVGARAFEESLE